MSLYQHQVDVLDLNYYFSTNRTLTTASQIPNADIFRLAAATPVPISPTVERQFYEAQLLLFALQRVRGEHSKRPNYHGELDQDATELRRSLVDKLAYICDFRRVGSTVTALALQKTHQGVKFWLAANETVKAKVKEFLLEILQLLKTVEDGASRKNIESQLLARIVSFNKERLDHYWSALSHDLDLCVERLENLQGTTSKHPSEYLKRRIRSANKLLPTKLINGFRCQNDPERS